jgi:hypothetical protein
MLTVVVLCFRLGRHDGQTINTREITVTAD